MNMKVADVPQRDGGMTARLPDGTHVGAVHLQISDLQRSIAYYEGVLGLELLDHGAGRAALGVAGAVPLIHLVEKRGAAPAPRPGRFGLFHFAILLPDRAALGRFASHVLDLGLRPAMADHAVSEALYLSDPDGLGIEVYADRPRAQWTSRDGELVMTTEPLNLDDLVRAGGGDWSGAPDGTAMGHVHLHVGSLSEADAFYHRALGFDITVWSYPGALFFSTSGYHHHLGTNIWSPGPGPGANEAQLLEWELVVPEPADLLAIAGRLQDSGYRVQVMAASARTSDPWGTAVRIHSGQQQ